MRESLTTLGAIFVMTSLLVGCASQFANDRPAIAALKSVSVAKTVNAPEKLYYFGPAQSKAGLAFGNLGAATARASAEEVENQLGSLMKARGSEITTIVRDTCVEEIRASGIPATLVDESGDAELRLQVEYYGLAPKSRLSSELVPTLRIRGELVDRSGSVIWEQLQHADVEDPSQKPVPLEALISEPELLIAAYRNSSRLICRQFLTQLKVR